MYLNTNSVFTTSSLQVSISHVWIRPWRVFTRKSGKVLLRVSFCVTNLAVFVLLHEYVA